MLWLPRLLIPNSAAAWTRKNSLATTSWGTRPISDSFLRVTSQFPAACSWTGWEQEVHTALISCSVA
ncbi:hypothetical protein Y1Q_0017646 [Alligator mississippiensis]|uniref:Uncharacterized protein n=1 Tax=Alligator mississippiensis TaxID=8496 RepID=A0A151MYN2_ALLMI|nr:hypothetical protein Y1Q_0017646 [Alligator mississippiensis]